MVICIIENIIYIYVYKQIDLDVYQATFVFT